MPTLWDHVLVVCITILLPVHDLLFWYPRLVRGGPGGPSRARRHAYRESIIVQWTLTALTAWIWVRAGRPWPELGVAAPAGWGFWLALLLAGVVIAAGTWQRLSLTRSEDEDTHEAMLDQLDHLRALLPHTRAELKQFSAVAVTAGLCEEVLFRGFVYWYLAALVPAPAAVVLAAALFGMAHAYQGTRGVLVTAGVGLGLMLLYIISGSLWVPMIVHVFIDLNSGLLAYTVLRRERESRRIYRLD